MKAYSFENWIIDSKTTPFLFFIQSVEEMLFPYGHDSYKVPTLNFHFLCIEMLQTIDKIDADVVDKGNMRPLFEELSAMLTNDKVAEKLYGTDFNRLFYNKNDKGEYARDCSNLNKDPGSEISLKVIQKTLQFLINDMTLDDKYLQTLKNEIEIVLKKPTFEIDEAQRLSGLSRLLLTELINRGYSQEYIYSKIKERYYSEEQKIEDISNEIEYFWNMFSFEEHKYNVTLPVKKAEVKKLLSHFHGVEITNNNDKLFGNSCRWLAKMEMEALDPQSARDRVCELISLFVSLKQYNSHVSKSFYTKQAVVVDLDNEKKYVLSKPVTVMSRGGTKSEEQTYRRIGEMLQSFPIIGEKMVNAINLHSSAMESINISNQLLNLWTIVEVLVEVDKRYSYSKITQISNTITTVQNASYVKSLIEQLLFDLKHCCLDIESHLEKITKGNNDIEKMAALLVLQEFEQNKTDLVNDLPNYPLLRYRIEHYAKQFSNRQELKKVLVNHRKRLEWQIMRIYRNRNMIVHDGSHFPYIDLVVQNLHFYVDNLIDTINYYVGKGYESLDIIYTMLSNKEFSYQMILEKTDASKKALPIGEDFVEVVLSEDYQS